MVASAAMPGYAELLPEVIATCPKRLHDSLQVVLSCCGPCLVNCT